MENGITKRLMTDKEAREVVAKINANMNNVRALVLDLYEREGWTAMGYASWRECVTAEFKGGQSYLYYQLEAAKVERNISTIVEKSQIPESQLRPLARLAPDQQRTAWAKAVETAPEGKVTAAHEAALADAQDMADILLDAEVRMGEILEGMPTHVHHPSVRGSMTSLPPEITHKQSHQAQTLSRNQDIVERAKALFLQLLFLGGLQALFDQKAHNLRAGRN